jgi:tetratricopeptide (TPR) repeat protein
MTSDNQDQSTTEVNGGFVHSLLLIDVLLRMKPVQRDKQELIALCNKEYKGNKAQLDVLRQFEKEYSSKNAFWWYTRNSFLYKMLNKALRVQNIDVLFLFRFFIRDIHRELERNQCQSPIRVYRGQVMSTDELNNLRKSIGKLISINSFFSTTSNHHQALEFINSSNISHDLHRVLFNIDADPRIITTKPFADISSYSDYTNEAEVLFMIGSIFRLWDIHRNHDQIWIVHLTLCGDDENDLKNLFEHMKESYGHGNDEATLLTFGRVLRRMGKFDLAEKFYRRLLTELPTDDPSLSRLHYSLGLVLRDKNNLDSSLEHLNNSLKMKMKTCPSDYEQISDCYNVIGTVYRRRGQHDIALSWFNRGVELLKQKNAGDSLKMAHFYNNIAIVYRVQGK